MKGQTIAEKILSQHVGTPVYAGELVITPVDGLMATDTTAPMAIKAFCEMGRASAHTRAFLRTVRSLFQQPIGILKGGWAIQMRTFIWLRQRRLR